MTLQEMGERMSSWEFALHWADFLRSPWDQDRADMRSAMVAATMVNITPNRKKGAPPARIEDFMLYRQERYHEPDAEEITSFIKGEET
jgi:hypothetical protein